MDLLSSLFPNDPAYEGLLSVDRVKSLQRNALLRAGIGVLGDTTGASPMQTGPALAKNLGPAIQGFPQEMSGAAEAAGRMRAFDQSEQIRTGRRQIIESNPKQPGESEVDWLQRLYPEFVKIGDTEIVSRLTQLLSSVQRQNQDIPQGTPHAGINPGINSQGQPDPAWKGKPDQYLVDRNGTMKWLNTPPTERTSQTEQEIMRQFNRENRLMDDYNKKIGPIEDAYTMIKPVFNSVPLAKAGDGTAQVELLYAFVRAMDPNSVVREGEVALARQATPIWNKARAWISEIEHNKAVVVPPETVNQMADLLRRRMGSYEHRWRSWFDQYQKRAKHWGVDPQTFYEPPKEFDTTSAGSSACQSDITKC